uniref:Globin domain-containing protein n=1 Tax=Bosea sp. NBC_00436 TaxID=2969620 RepID=A0A9E7ZRT2_9HYPH
MDHRSRSLILTNIVALFPIAEQTDATFANRLLETYPEVYRLFAMEIASQERSLVLTLRLMFGNSRQFEEVLPIVQELARSHRIYRLIEPHYQALAETLIWTLRRSLGTGFTGEAERAWLRALDGYPRPVRMSSPADERKAIA